LTANGKPPSENSTNEVTLSGGLKVTIDLTLLTIKEYRKMLSDSSEEEEAEYLNRITGLTYEQIERLNAIDFQRLVGTIIKIARNALANPT
jgi:DNA-directed RNA polymerase subunit F